MEEKGVGKGQTQAPLTHTNLEKYIVNYNCSNTELWVVFGSDVISLSKIWISGVQNGWEENKLQFTNKLEVTCRKLGSVQVINQVTMVKQQAELNKY